MALDATAAFESAAGFFVELVDTIAPTAWNGPGLGEWDLRSLVGHTARSFTTVITYLTHPAEVVDMPSAVEYYRWTVQAVDALGQRSNVVQGEDFSSSIG